MNKIKVLDLFAGIGGMSLGLERTGGFETVAFCEIEEFPQKVLRKHWPDVPIFNDVRTITEEFDGETVELICGGYPCQPFSHAGKRKGQDDDRHLWPAMLDCIKKYRPTWVIGENVVGHISMGLDSVLSDLEGEGYEARAFVIPACAVDAPHRRDRVWIVANANDILHAGELDTRRNPKSSGGSEGSNKSEGQASHGQRVRAELGASGKTLADTNGINAQGEQPGIPDQKVGGEQRERPAGSQDASNGRLWLPEPNVGRVANGVPSRVDRLKSLGNAVVPQVVERIGYAILEAENESRSGR